MNHRRCDRLLQQHTPLENMPIYTPAHVHICVWLQRARERVREGEMADGKNRDDAREVRSRAGHIPASIISSRSLQQKSARAVQLLSKEERTQPRALMPFFFFSPTLLFLSSLYISLSPGRVSLMVFKDSSARSCPAVERVLFSPFCNLLFFSPSLSSSPKVRYTEVLRRTIGRFSRGLTLWAPSKDVFSLPLTSVSLMPGSVGSTRGF